MKKILGLFLSLIISLLFITACNSTIEFSINFEIKDNGAISIPTDLEKDGYEFKGWYCGKDEWQNPFK